MRADWEEQLPPAGILEREEIEMRRYRGMNPSFVRRVWTKRRQEAGKVSRPHPGKPGAPPKWTDEEKARVAEMLKAGRSSGQIAKAMRKTIGSISGIVHKDPELRAIGFQSSYAKRLRDGNPIMQGRAGR